jgi:hypothetical protein
MIKVQGPRTQDYYYKTAHSPEYTVEYWLDGVLIEQIDSDVMPNASALWRDNFAHQYPGVETQ